jgi:hypothetical protein
LANRLGIPKISAIEFGVAGGNGIVAMEQHAAEIRRLLGTEIEIYGFDTGEGLTPPQDYRDMPYTFKAGNYKMDVPKLKARLPSATLILGDITDTANRFFEEHNPAPIGFCSMDMDYYTSTAIAFRLFSDGLPETRYLPRIFMHMDDVTGDEISLHNEFTGEGLAIAEFNAENSDIKIAQNRSFRKLPFNFEWHYQSFVMHRFSHPAYSVYISKHSADNNSLVD